ncbi:tetratricopeptide repeat protein [Botrimarina hoheduenensis]|uniref:Photosystem I assembly protein Ycf3 n=1 Tax=Botrimarina hoheduenensis TaxID=2528000 RepID=A0A5C5WC06_9BACT|nr:tetratricopeptide repeat protein [Botrimarina hoheduenensis]TWT47609.1 photosystem I assembly protein Ycf3 [Botrimarina hoheduenensis]
MLQRLSLRLPLMLAFAYAASLTAHAAAQHIIYAEDLPRGVQTQGAAAGYPGHQGQAYAQPYHQPQAMAPGRQISQQPLQQRPSVFSSLGGIKRLWSDGEPQPTPKAVQPTSEASQFGSRRGSPRGARSVPQFAHQPSPTPSAKSAPSSPGLLNRLSQSLFASDPAASAPPQRSVPPQDLALAAYNERAPRSGSVSVPAQRPMRGGILATPRQAPQGLLSDLGWGGSESEEPARQEVAASRGRQSASAIPTTSQPGLSRVVAAAPLNTAPSHVIERVTAPSRPQGIAAERHDPLSQMMLPSEPAPLSASPARLAPQGPDDIAGMIVVSDTAAAPTAVSSSKKKGPREIANPHVMATPERTPVAASKAPAAVSPKQPAAAQQATSQAKLPVVATKPRPTGVAASSEPSQGSMPSAQAPTALPSRDTLPTLAEKSAAKLPATKPQATLPQATPPQVSRPSQDETLPVVVESLHLPPEPKLAVTPENDFDSQPLATPTQRVAKPQDPAQVAAAPLMISRPAYEKTDLQATAAPFPSETVEDRVEDWAIVADTPRVAPRHLTEIEEQPAMVEPSPRARDLLTEARDLGAEATTPDDFQAVVQRCRYVLAIDESPEAIGYANKLAAWALTKRGELLMDAEQPVEAGIDFEEALRCEADCWRALHNLGILAAQRGDNAKARDLFRKTLDLNPEYAKAHSNLAALSVIDGEFEDALSEYRTAILIDPDLGVAHAGRGRVCHMLGKLDAALRHLDAAFLLNPNDSSIASARGDLLVDLGRYGLAKEAYARAIDQSPNDPTAHRNLAWLLATCPVEAYRNGQEALAHAAQAERLLETPDDILLDTTAAALAAAGRFEEASQVARDAIAIAPEPDATEYRQRLALYEQGEAFLTQPAVRQASQSNPLLR